MRSPRITLLAAVLVFLVAGPGSALAANPIPPGNSGADQYTEGVPGAGGNEPSSGGGSSNDSRSGVPGSAYDGLASQGDAAAAAAAVLQASSPDSRALNRAVRQRENGRGLNSRGEPSSSGGPPLAPRTARLGTLSAPSSVDPKVAWAWRFPSSWRWWHSVRWQRSLLAIGAAKTPRQAEGPPSLRRGLLILAALVAALAFAASASAERGLNTGFADFIYQLGDESESNLYLDRSVTANAGIIRVFVRWDDVVGNKPSDPANPGDASYNFVAIDMAVAGAAARGLSVLLTTYQAPAWAEGPNRKPSAPAGSWKVDPGDLADFEKALARRYSGSFEGLPRVRYLQVWNEPGLDTYLAPQWAGKKPFAAEHYRRMINASYKAIKSVRGGNQVVSAGLAPYGDARGGTRTRPLTFWRQLLCLRSDLKPACRAKTRFDVFGEHAINTSGPPRRSALNKNDMSTGDLAEGRKILRAAEKANTVTGGQHPIWVTEFWWESDPPVRHRVIR